MTDSARELTSSIAAGNTAAFERFYRAWFDAVLADARRVSGRDEQFCMDIVQETMMRVVRSIPPLETAADVQRWLRVVTQRCCYDQLRREARRSKRERASANNSREEEAIDKNDDRLLWLREELRQMDPRHRHLLGLRFRCEWTLSRIGQSLGLKPGAVDGRIARVLSGLRERAAEDLHD